MIFYELLLRDEASQSLMASILDVRHRALWSGAAAQMPGAVNHEQPSSEDQRILGSQSSSDHKKKGIFSIIGAGCVQDTFPPQLRNTLQVVSSAASILPQCRRRGIRDATPVEWAIPVARLHFRLYRGSSSRIFSSCGVAGDAVKRRTARGEGPGFA